MTFSSKEAPFVLEVPRHLHDKRFDSALATLLQERYSEEKVFSRAFAARAIKEGRVLLNSVPALPRTLVVTHDLFSINPATLMGSVQSQEEKGALPILRVLFEDEHILVVDKGPGIQVHQGGSFGRATVVDWILAHYPNLSKVGEDPLRPGIVHRLDRDTSGILIIAKETKSFEALKKAFQERAVEKTYVALVSGHLPALQGEVSAPLIRRSGELKRQAIDPETYKGTLPGTLRSAFTAYRVIQRFEGYDLLLVMPKTGRTHQIRVHLSFLGHPVVGDKLYAFKETKGENRISAPRHMLHATSLSLTLFDKKYHFSSPLPGDFQAVLQSIDETAIASYDDEALKSLF